MMISKAFILGTVAAVGLSMPVSAVDTAFSYQGRLSDAGAPATGDYDFRFLLYTAEVGGSQVGPILYGDDTQVIDGFFTIYLDFGAGIFDGTDLWLEVSVRDGASTGTYTQLAPRQSILPSPYSLYAAKITWGNIEDMPPDFADGVDDDTTYTPGSGLTLAATQFSITPDGVTSDHLGSDSVEASEIAADAVGISELDTGAIFEPIQNFFSQGSFVVDAVAATGVTIATETIDVPTSGSVLALVSALYWCINCSASNPQVGAFCTISRNPLASADSGDNIFVSQLFDSSGQARESLSFHDVFTVSAGATSFYFRCGVQYAGDEMYVSYPHFSLVFIPD